MAEQMVESLNQKPVVVLTGQDGNAFSILARARKAARRAGWPNEKVEQYTTKATSGDYDKLLLVTCEMFEVE